MSAPGTVEVGTELPGLAVHLTRETLVRYAGASTDFNAIHYSDFYAARLGLPSVIAHGMLTMGTALRIVTDWVGDPGRVTSYSARFTRPVAVPDTADGALVEIRGRVTKVDGGVATVTIDAVCDGVKLLGSATAEVSLD